MEYIKKEEIEKRWQEISEAILNGKSIVFPTETVYGIGTNAFDEEACRRIYEIKKRPSNKPLIVLVHNEDMLYKVIENTNEIEKELIEKFWPGPLTIIFRKKTDGELANCVTSGGEYVGVRMTNGDIARRLIREASVPIVAPSANLSGSASGTRLRNIISELGNKVDYILDCGDIEDETTSTLVKVENDCIHILRLGKITKEQLEKITCNVFVDL